MLRPTILISFIIALPVWAAQPDDYCLVRLNSEPELMKNARRYPLVREPYSIPNLPLEISNPSEGKLSLRHLETNFVFETWQPTGDPRMRLTGYDPRTQIAYGNSTRDVGWLKLKFYEDYHLVVESGLVRPKLYRKPDSLRSDSTASPRFSRALGRLFYSGYSKAWCCTWRRGFQSFEIIGGDVSAVPKADGKTLTYMDDDPVEKKAVLRDEDGILYHYNGETVAKTTNPMFYWQKDPLTEHDLLRDKDGYPYRYDGQNLTRIDTNGILGSSVTGLYYRKTRDRWVIRTADDWYLYRASSPLRALNMPQQIVRSWTWLVELPDSLDSWLLTSNGIWWEQEKSAILVSKPPSGQIIKGSAYVGTMMSGDAIAFATGVPGPQSERDWYSLRYKDPSETCRTPGSLAAGWR